MSATQDKSQKFVFDWDRNFYLLWKQGEFDVNSVTPVVIPKIKKDDDERSEPV